ncbi:hypothetical protein [Mucilaginibacter defluvii]|uniref:Uncharacterized protein n=1 Tax=Mucilaginibacter defluvii TaxID=1196019 RepID=A0ABP9FKR7_9SPHI
MIAQKKFKTSNKLLVLYLSNRDLIIVSLLLGRRGQLLCLGHNVTKSQAEKILPPTGHTPGPVFRQANAHLEIMLLEIDKYIRVPTVNSLTTGISNARSSTNSAKAQPFTGQDVAGDFCFF